jgi:hypothetical protein
MSPFHFYSITEKKKLHTSEDFVVTFKICVDKHVMPQGGNQNVINLTSAS